MTRHDAFAASSIAVIALLCLVGGHLSRGNQSAARCLDLSAPAPHQGMAWIAGGAFAQGDTVYAEEGPISNANVKGLWMDRHEVTNGEFAAFVRATGYVTQAERALDGATHAGLPADMLRPGAVVFFMPKDVHGLADISQWWRFVPGANWRHPAGPGSSLAGRENYPVVEVTHDDALAYARWKGRDLPSEAEWEWAARAGDPKAGDDHDQPRSANTWQGIFPVLNSGDDGFVGLAPAGCYAANAYGLYDMLGNVWELTNDVYRPRRGETPGPDAMPAMGEDKRYVIKGGSFLCAPNYCMRYRSGAREGQEADLAASHLGFRTVLRQGTP
ncbi:MAG TPA: formylglycine-generating enzyme family protein [Rhizomicrobium sp.]